jgi:enoyl-[acyl-carrier protein] reductase I
MAASLMAGKKGVIMGIANERSLAWGIAKAASAAGAELAFTYQGEALAKRVQPLAERAGARLVLPADVTDQTSLDVLFASLAEQWGRLDFLVHAIAFADREELKGRYIDTSAGNFQRTLMISCYSFTELCRRAVPLMEAGGGLLTLTYLGAERVTWAAKGSASTPSPRGRSGPWPPRASATSATSSSGTSTTRP